jgi:prevent-host-death family protein
MAKRRWPTSKLWKAPVWRVTPQVKPFHPEIQVLKIPIDSDGHLSDNKVMISFISTRELSKRPGQVMAKVTKEGPQVITQNGVPAAYIIPTSGRGIEADLDLLRRVLLGRALDAAQAEAARSGTATMTLEEINAEITASRQERKLKQSQDPVR